MGMEFFEHDNNTMTPEQLRKYPGLGYLTDEDALKSIETLKKLTALIFEFHSKDENNLHDEIR